MYLVGESFGGVLALEVAAGLKSKPPAGLAGLALINAATAVRSAWPAQLPAVLDALAALPSGVSEVQNCAFAEVKQNDATRTPERLFHFAKSAYVSLVKMQ